MPNTRKETLVFINPDCWNQIPLRLRHYMRVGSGRGRLNWTLYGKAGEAVT